MAGYGAWVSYRNSGRVNGKGPLVRVETLVLCPDARSQFRIMLYVRISEPASWAVLHTAIKEIRGSKRLHHPGLNPEIHVLKNVAHG